MLLNHLLLLPTGRFAVHIPTDLAKMRAKERVALVQIILMDFLLVPLQILLGL